MNEQERQEIINEIKEHIKFVSANKQLNQRMSESLAQPDDCFGVKYDPNNPECRICLILTELGEERRSLNSFCCEVSGGKYIDYTQEYIPESCPKEFQKSISCFACSKMPECQNKKFKDTLDEIGLRDRILREIDRQGEVYQGWLYRKLNAHRFKEEFNKAIEDLQKQNVIEAISDKRGIVLKRVSEKR